VQDDRDHGDSGVEHAAFLAFRRRRSDRRPAQLLHGANRAGGGHHPIREIPARGAAGPELEMAVHRPGRRPGQPARQSDHADHGDQDKDNVFVTIPISVQNRVRPEKVYDAFYKLSDPMQQIQAYVEQVILGHVPGMTLDEVFASQSGIAAAVKQELDADMAGFGYEIVNVLVTDIVPDAKVKSAMNDINAAQREQVAAAARGEAEKILVVKKAEAEAQSKALQGQGIANQRKAIIEGLQGSIEQFQRTVAGASTADVMQLVMITQYFDTIKSIGETDKTNTLFLSHSPTAVRDISEQIMQSMLVADRAKS
jgi:regulator of protease activity HflC (stomatin/prohibitin superfamily)